MIGPDPAILVDTLPWWIAMPLLQLGLLGLGMALDETYVNRTTILAGAMALYVHSLVTDGLWLPVSLYTDVGLVVGVYGLHAYVVDGYVPNWFRVLAYFVYSPLSVFLVIVFPDLIFFVALAIAGYGNLQLLAYFRPAEPYYFGPETNAEFEAVVLGEGDLGEDAESADSPADSSADQPSGTSRGRTDPAAGASRSPDPAASTSQRTDPAATTSGATSPGAGAGAAPRTEPASEAGPSERGILPEFMRRL